MLLFRLIARPRALTAKAAAERKAEIDRLADGLYNRTEEEMEMVEEDKGEIFISSVAEFHEKLRKFGGETGSLCRGQTIRQPVYLRRPFVEVARGVPPFLIILLVVTCLLVAFPQIALFLPELAYR